MTVVPSSRPVSGRAAAGRAARLVAAALAAALLLVGPVAPAWAHNSLKSATPAADTTLTSAPQEVVLEFMSSLNPQYTTVTVTGPDQQEVGAAPEVAGARATVALGDTLTNGAYTVAYRVVSSDGHPVQGSYAFTLAVPGAAAPPATSAQPTTAPTPAAELTADSTGVSGVTIAAIVIALLLLASAIVFFWIRSRRTP